MSGVMQFFSDVGSKFAKGFSQDYRAGETQIESAQQGITSEKLRAQLSAMKAGMDAATVYGGMETPEGKAAFQTTLSSLGYQDMAGRYASITANTEARNLAMQQERAKLEGIQAGTEATKSRTKVAETLLPGEVQNQQFQGQATQANTAANQFQVKRGEQLLPGEFEQQKAETKWYGERGTTAKASVILGMLRAGWDKDMISSFFDTYLPEEKEEPQSNAQKTGIETTTPPSGEVSKPEISNFFGDTGNLVPPSDYAVSRIIEAAKARQPAFNTPDASYADTGDGQSKLPLSYRDIGIQDPNTAEQFQALESMIGKSLPPEFNLRKAYQMDPKGFKDLLDRIRDKTPGKEKLSVEQIIKFILGTGE